MQLKNILLHSCLLGLCVVVGIFLYNHMHQEYPIDEEYAEAATETTEQAEAVAFPLVYQKEVDEQLKFDVKIEAGTALSGGEFTMATAQKQKLNEAFIAEQLIGNELLPTSYKSTDEEGEKIVLDVYDNGGKFLAVSESSFTYTKSPDIDYIHHTFYPDSKTDQYNSFLYSQSSDLDFMDREAAWDAVVAQLEAMEVDMSRAIPTTVFSMDLETMKQEERYVDHNDNIVLSEKNPHWDKEEEGYRYSITQEYEGIPLYAYKRVDTWYGETDAPMTVFQNANGFMEIKLLRWFAITEQEEKARLVPIDEIMSVVEEKYTGTIHTNPLTVKEANLYIFPIKNEEGIYVLTPVWVCRIEEEHTGEIAFKSYICMALNALTGEEMPSLVD